VAIENVAQVLELDSLVRTALCPPGIVGLCPYHRQVVPVAALPGDQSAWKPDARENRASDKSVGETVLIMQTEYGAWGLRIDRGGTVITAASPSRHEPVQRADGTVTVGVVRHGGADHELLDAAATWRGLRDMVGNWYVQIRETHAQAALP
jgi:purine-binding chemotaxis protein CheW